MIRPRSTRDLFHSEQRFVVAMYELGFGRFESLRIQTGELVLDPWPATVRGVKFASEDPSTSRTPPDEFALKRQETDHFEYVRAVDGWGMACLEVRNGLP